MMRKKDLADVCQYMKALIIPHMPDDFRVAEKFRQGLTEDEIRQGIAAFRDFMYALFDRLAANKDVIDVKTRDQYNPYDKHDKSNVRVCFPTIYDLAMILFTLGIRGRLDMKEKKLSVCVEDLLSVICEKTEKYISLIKMSGERKLEMFGILYDLGLRFHGANFSKEVDFTKTNQFDITFIHNDFFVIGLKLLAEATLNHKHYYYIMNVFSVLLQCDFYPLANTAPKKHEGHINAFSNPQTPEIREWVKSVDELLIGHDCTMVHSNGSFLYAKRGRSVTYGMVCVIGLDITGCFVTPGVNHLSKPNNILELLSDDMMNEFMHGDQRDEYNPAQCHRQSGNMRFARFAYMHNGEAFEGCRHAGLRCRFSGVKCRFTGYRYDLADPCIREWMKKWIQMELEV